MTEVTLQDSGHPMGRAQRCGAQLRGKPGRHCRQFALVGRTRCKLHGGASRRGAESATFKNGKYSNEMPVGLRRRYEEHLKDSTLGALRDELAAAEVLIAEAIRNLEGKKGKAFDTAAALVFERMDHKRKLAESEAQRLKDSHQMISVQRALAAMRALVNAVVENVKDAHVVGIIESEFLRLTS